MHLGFGWDESATIRLLIDQVKLRMVDLSSGLVHMCKSQNEVSLDVCLVGKDYFTKKQYISLEKVLRKWKLKYPEAKIIGHRDIGNTEKTCPNFDVISWSKNKNL